MPKKSKHWLKKINILAVIAILTIVATTIIYAGENANDATNKKPFVDTKKMLSSTAGPAIGTPQDMRNKLGDSFTVYPVSIIFQNITPGDDPEIKKTGKSKYTVKIEYEWDTDKNSYVGILYTLVNKKQGIWEQVGSSDLYPIDEYWAFFRTCISQVNSSIGTIPYMCAIDAWKITTKQKKDKTYLYIKTGFNSTGADNHYGESLIQTKPVKLN